MYLSAVFRLYILDISSYYESGRYDYLSRSNGRKLSYTMSHTFAKIRQHSLLTVYPWAASQDVTNITILEGRRS
jgi:hypothetical protein